ncbi:MAG: SoxR reducing system RseC family protein [Nevskiales bacterium]
MLEEQATVLSVEQGAVWVEADRQAGCERCEAGQGCGGGVLGKLVKRGSSRVRALSDIPGLQQGDQVVIGLDERLLVSGSLMTYLMPLICLLLAAIFAEQVLQTSDLAVAAAGMLGLAVGLLILRAYTRRLTQRGEIQPRVLRKASGMNVGCQVKPSA